MLMSAVQLYKACELTGFQIEIKDINHSSDVPSSLNPDEALSYYDANLLINILLNLED